MEVEARISQIFVDQAAAAIVLVLENTTRTKFVSIVIGAQEASSIAREIEGVAPSRPQTHDLIKNMLFSMGTFVRCVAITQLKDDTFYAILRITNNGETIWLDSRPSDAIALALRMNCPIYVEESLLSSPSNEA